MNTPTPNHKSECITLHQYYCEACEVDWKQETVYRDRCPVCSTLTEPRSEEHTSELQSLMRISYAVFRLKKTITIVKFSSMRSRPTQVRIDQSVIPITQSQIV